MISVKINCLVYSFYRAALPWFEGHSIFYVNSEGRISRHVVDKRTEEENRETVEQMRNKVRPSQFKI